MNNTTGYKQQQRLALMQFLSEVPSFLTILVSALLSRTVLVFVDLLDSLGYLLRAFIVTILSKKLTKDLRYEYNYGIGKIEAISSLLCDGIVFFGLLLTLGMSVYSIIHPTQPSGLLIAVVGLKVINVIVDTVFLIKQYKIKKLHRSAISETNFAAALGALLFDSVTLVSLLVIWLLRSNPIGAYISPVISIFVAIYLMIGCIKRIKQALSELSDKTLPEEDQMKILNILIRFYNSYSQVCSVKSHKIGDSVQIDLHLAFEKDTSYEEIVTLNKQMQAEFGSQFDNCVVNIIVADD